MHSYQIPSCDIFFLIFSGTVTASPSPLGLGASGSLTPPPTLTSTTSLQLGGLTTTANRSLLSAAPGAEAMNKFRAVNNGATPMFSATTAGAVAAGSLFAKLGGVPRPLGGGGTSPLEAKPSGRSRLLEDFRLFFFPNFFC